MTRSRLFSLLFFAAFAISFVLSILRFNSFQVGAFSDDANYIVTAEGIAAGEGFRLINYPNKPVNPYFGIMWPLMLAPLTQVAPGDYTALKALSLVLWLASIYLSYRLLAPRLASPYTEMVVFLIALNPMLIGHASMILSEMAYIFFSLIALILFDFWDRHYGQAHWGYVCLAAVLAFLTQMTRVVGLSLILSLAIYILLNRRWRDLLIFVLTTGLGLLIQTLINQTSGRNVLYSDSDILLEQGITILDKIGQVLINIREYSSGMISSSILNVFGPNITQFLDQYNLSILLSIVNITILLLLFIGFILAIRRFPILALYTFVYAGVLLSFWWPQENQGAYPRFLVPLLPILYYYVVIALEAIWNGLLRQKRQAVPLAVAAVVAVMCLISIGRNIQDWRSPSHDRLPDIEAGRDWIQANSPEDAVVMAPQPSIDYLYARRLTVPYPPTDMAIDYYLELANVSYIIVAERIDPEARPALESSLQVVLEYLSSEESEFVIGYENADEDVVVYQRVENSS